MKQCNQLFHETLNNLNILSAVSFTNVSLLEDVVNNQSSQDNNDDILMEIQNSFSSIEEGFKSLFDNVNTIIEMIQQDESINSEADAYVNEIEVSIKQLKDTAENMLNKKDLCLAEDFQKNIPAIKDIFNELYEKVHLNARHILALKKKLIKLGKYSISPEN